MRCVVFCRASTGPNSFSCSGAGVGQLDLLPQQPVIPAVLEDVLCGLFCFSTGAPGGWHEAESII